MKNKSILLSLAIACSGLFVISCDQSSKQSTTPQSDGSHKVTKTDVVLKDYGAEPAVLDIEDYTSANTNFRTALWTGTHLQVTLMSIPVGGDVGLEQHPDIDQFLRIEEGKAKVEMGNTKDSLLFTQLASEDFAILVPAGKWHNITNVGDKPLKLYSIYAPVEHPHGTVHKTQKEAMDAEHH